MVTIFCLYFSQLDYETRRQHTITIRAIDHGYERQLYTDVNVTITVIDVNDEYPEFTATPFIANVSNDGADQIIAYISAVDRDATEPNSIVYYK